MDQYALDSSLVTWAGVFRESGRSLTGNPLGKSLGAGKGELAAPESSVCLEPWWAGGAAPLYPGHP